MVLVLGGSQWLVDGVCTYGITTEFVPALAPPPPPPLPPPPPPHTHTYTPSILTEISGQAIVL